MAGVPAGYARLVADAAAPADLALVHDEKYIESVQAMSRAGSVRHTDPDTVISPGTWRAALCAAGAMRLAIETVMQDRARRVFCIVRPPGHHAGRDHTRGFCFFNSIAVGARIAQREYGVQRIAIIDWDAHHGNGTQDEFYEEAGVYYFSLHQSPLFPGTGLRPERGKGAGRGYTMNIPLAPGATDREVCAAFRDEIEPEIEAYRPELVLVSAGFDGHGDEHLAGLMLTDEGYARMTRFVVEWADRFAGGRVVSLLEGGYHLPALTACVHAHLNALAFRDQPGGSPA